MHRERDTNVTRSAFCIGVVKTTIDVGGAATGTQREAVNLAQCQGHFDNVNEKWNVKNAISDFSHIFSAIN